MAMTVEDMRIAMAAHDDTLQVVTPVHSVSTVGAVATVVPSVAANANRRYLLLINDSDETMYVAMGAQAALNTGIRLNAAGGSYEMAQGLGNLYAGAIYAICASGSKKLLVTEA